jgi:predicted dienelactone hydrolase
MHSRWLRRISLGFLPTFLLLAGCSSSRENSDGNERGSELVGTAPDATEFGPLATSSGEYRLPAAVDADVLTDRATEIWASVFRPATLAAGEKHPLLVFLHGNHGTCGRGSSPRIDDNVQYTAQGTCPEGYTVVPNHRGYDYVAQRLASWGYVVVSVNANRGITAAQGPDDDFGLNLARGRLVLKHLALLSDWNAQPGTTPASLGVDLAGTLDFDHVGLMGHSRGGEGVRAAYNQYLDPGSVWPARIKAPVKVRGIFEVGPVDGQTSRTLNALGTSWNVLLPMCDGDVFDHQGMMPFDRMLAASGEANPSTKSVVAVWGANHNYYNTEWQQTDSTTCSGPGHKPLFALTGVSGSTKQQATGLHAMMSFFRANVGKDKNADFAKAFDPEYAVADALTAITRVERAYTIGIDRELAFTVEDFTGEAGKSKAGLPTVANNIAVRYAPVLDHDWDLRAAELSWAAAGADSNYEIDWAAAGIDVSSMGTLDFRISRTPFATNPDGPTNFSIRLVKADGSFSEAAHLRDYIELVGPAGGPPVYGPVCSQDGVCHGSAAHPMRHPILDTVRIPLSAFAGADLAHVRGVQFVFDDAPGAVLLSTIRFSKTAPEAPLANSAHGDGLGPDVPAAPVSVITTGNRVAGMRQPAAGAPLEIEVESQATFPVTDSLVRLRIGDRDVVASRYLDDGDTHRLVFTMKPSELATVKNGAPMTVRYGAKTSNVEYDFGTFQKDQIKP